MQIKFVKSYLTSLVKNPFFLFISDNEYQFVVNELKAYEPKLDFVPISSFCSGYDKIPDIDGLLSYIEEADVNAIGKKFVVTGMGEFLATRGLNEALSTLLRFKDFNVGGAKVILLLRGLAALVPKLETDPRFDARRYVVVDDAECNLSYTLAATSVGLSALKGFKTMLEELENGKCGNIVVNTDVNFDKALFTVQRINSAYEGIKFSLNGFSLSHYYGTEAQWSELLIELNQSNSSLDEVFTKHGLSGNTEIDFFARVAGDSYSNWLYFVYLKSKANTLQNSYLRYVLDKSSRFEDFRGNVLNAIIEIPHTSKQFQTFYNERKLLIEKYSENFISDFVINNRLMVNESIFKLTDNTLVERKEIITWLTSNGLLPQLDNIYPALAAYLKKYVFKCAELADLLTDYFEAYKKQKVLNQLEPEFLKKVDEIAISRKFNQLPTRNEIIDSIDKGGTFLYWLDALGVEYLGLIEALVQKKGLSMRIEIARAELPTITSVNRKFFDEWLGTKNGDKRLDDIKHKENGGYSFLNSNLPIHLVEELDIVESVIDKAATELALRHCKRFLIVSDHGASRLAVLRKKEEKYDTDTIGKHSGRCCKLFQPYNLPFAAEENGYLVLADYGRFRGSRAANVEVHGGASLEEVIVPIIELSLKNRSITVKLVSENITVDFRSGTEILLFFNAPVQNISVVLNSKAYQAVQTDSNHYIVKLPDTKRAGNYPADVYAGDDLIGKILIKAQGKSGRINDDFDDLF